MPKAYVELTSLYDSYIKAFRWASNRIEGLNDGGIVAFISNGSWIDGNAQDGMRKCLQDEFTTIYVFNLRGNALGSGEIRRKEKDNVFGQGTKTGITITFLIKNPSKSRGSVIYYHDIGDYLTKDKKLDIVKNFHTITNVEWQIVHPNDKNDWINLRDGLFDSLIELTPAKKFDLKAQTVFSLNSQGIGTSRDAWCYNFSQRNLLKNMENTITFYNQQVDDYTKAFIENPKLEVTDFMNTDETKISWSSSLIPKLEKLEKAKFEPEKIITASFRPFVKNHLYIGEKFIHRRGQTDSLFPQGSIQNLTICLTGIGSLTFSCLISSSVSDLCFVKHGNGGEQCFPLYWYEDTKDKEEKKMEKRRQKGGSTIDAFEQDIFDVDKDRFIRHDGITDWILQEVRSRYGTREITKEMIFYYVYGLLHSEDYRQRFAADLKKSLPRIPIVERVEDFMDFYKYGKKLADLHLNYETVAPYPGAVVKGDRKVTYETKRDPATGGFIEDTTNPEDYDYFHIWDKMRFKSKDDKSTIIYNGNITIENIPEKAYEYIVNGKSAIEWIVERYCVSRDKKSLIMNDANDWGKEHHKPRYILDLLLSVINVSVQTVDIVKALPKLKFD